MELNLTFSENRAIRVIVMPVGDISPEKYREYSSLIKTINIIELSSITRSPNEISPLEKISWIDGNMLLNFVESAHYIKSDYEDIQLFKKVFGVIGIADCKKSKDLLETKRKFEESVHKYPGVVSSLCCAFDPSDDQPDLNLGENLIMIPNNNDKKHLFFYLTTLLIDFSHMILKHFERMISDHDSSVPAYISTPLDATKTWDEISKAKKRKSGRLYKLKGDYCLLSGSPLDAIKFYDLSIELTKANSDLEWLASSYEGYITSMILKRNQEFNSQSQNNLSPTSGQGNYLPDSQIQVDDQHIQTMSVEALQSYNKRKTVTFEMELSLKIANYNVSMDRKIEAADLLTNTYDLAFELPLPERILITCSIALIYYSMGFKRKFAFYIREAVFIYNKKPENWDKIRNLLMIASPYYQLSDLFAQNPAKFLDEGTNKAISFTLGQMKLSKSKSSKPQSRQNVTVSGGKMNTGRVMPQLSIHKKKEGWTVIQRYLIHNLISVSVNLSDHLNVCKYTIYLLRTQYKFINQQKQLEDLLAHSKYLSISINTNVHMNSLGLPFLVKLQPLVLPSHLQPQIKPTISATASATNNNLFIYSPYERDKNKSKQNTLLWVEDECNVLVTLSNPFSFEVPIQSLTLSTAGVPFESYPMAFKALPLTDRFEVVLTGRPLKPGPLIIKGVFIKSFGLLSEHPINPQGISISLSEYHVLCKKDAYKVESYDTVGLPTSPPSPTSYYTSGGVDDDIINKITVVPQMPILNVRVPTFGNRLDLFAGEHFIFNWEFENIGNKNVDQISIKLGEIDKNLKKSVQAANSSYADTTNDEYDEFTSFSWDSNQIKKNLPLEPGQSFILPITVFTRPYLIGNQFQIEYSNLADEYQRKLTISVPLNIVHGPQISNFDILFSSLPTLNSINSFLITNNIISQYDNNQNLNNNNNSDQNNHCLLVIDIKNVSSTHSFIISHENEKSQFTLSPNSVINVLIPMKREPFPLSLPPIRIPKGQYIKPKNKLTKHEKYLNRLIQFYKDLLIKNIKLKWISSDNTNGIIYINNIILTPKLVYKIKSDPIEIEFSDKIYSKNIGIGEFCTINISLRNVSRSPLTGLVLHIQPTSDKLLQQNKSSLSELTNKIGYVGSLSHPIQELPANTSYNHSMQFVFFEKDVYRFIVTCELGNTREAIPSPKPLIITVN